MSLRDLTGHRGQMRRGARPDLTRPAAASGGGQICDMPCRAPAVIMFIAQGCRCEIQSFSGKLSDCCEITQAECRGGLVATLSTQS